MPKLGFVNIAMFSAPWIEALRAAAEYGFKAFELDCIYPETGPELIADRLIDEVLEIKEKTGIEFCVHAPFYELNIAAHCRGIRKESIKSVKYTVDLCRKTGAEVMVIHNGSHDVPGPPGVTRQNYGVLSEQWDHNIDALKEINDYAGENDVTVCLENVCFTATSIDRNFADLLEIREKVGPTLKYTFDMGHARLSEGIWKGIKMMGDNIRHIHLADNFGKKDDHFIIGAGDIDYSQFKEYLNNFPYVITLEVADASSTPEPMLKSRQYLKQLGIG